MGVDMKSAIGAVVLLGSLLCGCTAVELDSLVPSSVLDYATPDDYPIVKTCNPSHLNSPDETQITQAISKVHSVLPSELKGDPVVNTVLAHAQYVTANSRAAAKSLLKSGTVTPTAVVPKPANTLTHLDIDRFSKVISSQVLRRTPATANASDPNNTDPFWQKLRAYYIAYYDGKFNTFFGDNLAKPTASLTISDNEILQAATVFVELLMDEALGAQIWIGPDNKTYYPGGNTNKPTSLTVNNITPPSIKAGPEGCGMNVAKANAMRYLELSFSKAASTETALAIKSAGSIEIGLGIVGKLNIGDNNLLSSLVTGIVSEIVGRLTVQIATPILEAIDFEKQPTLAQTSPTTVQVVSKTTNLKALPKAQINRIMTSPFVSAKPTAI
jgi:hypothetical protein